MALHPGERKRHFPEKAPVAWDPVRQALEEDEDWYRDLVEHSQDLLCVHDLQGRLLSINPVPARLLGYSVEEIMRTPMRDIVDPQFRSQFDDYLRDIERTGESRGLLAVVDVTELREASEALREAKKKLTEEKLYLEQEINTELGFAEIIGQSKALEAVMGR